MGTTIFAEDTTKMTVKELFAEKNDPACQEEIVKRYLPKMRKLAERNGRNEDEIEEIFSVLSECLWECVLRYNDDEDDLMKYRHFATYLGLKAREWVIWHWKKPNEKEEKLRKWMDICDADRVLDTENFVMNGMILRKLTERLTDREWEVLRHRFWEEKSYESTGRMMNICRDRARQIEVKALRKCRWKAEKNDVKWYDSY